MQASAKAASLFIEDLQVLVISRECAGQSLLGNVARQNYLAPQLVDGESALQKETMTRILKYGAGVLVAGRIAEQTRLGRRSENKIVLFREDRMARIETSDDIKSASHDFADKTVDAGLRAMDTLEQTATNVQDAGQRLVERGHELGDNVQKVAQNFADAIDKSVDERPMTTLGMAVAAGFILGAIWKA